MPVWTLQNTEYDGDGFPVLRLVKAQEHEFTPAELVEATDINDMIVIAEWRDGTKVSNAAYHHVLRHDAALREAVAEGQKEMARASATTDFIRVRRSSGEASFAFGEHEFAQNVVCETWRVSLRDPSPAAVLQLNVWSSEQGAVVAISGYAAGRYVDGAVAMRTDGGLRTLTDLIDSGWIDSEILKHRDDVCDKHRVLIKKYVAMSPRWRETVARLNAGTEPVDIESVSSTPWHNDW